MFSSILLNIDSYKASHYLQYPPNTRFVSTYIESRGGVFDETLFFGLQLFVKQWLLSPITHDMIDEAEAVLLEHGLPFNREGWSHIVDNHNGLLPLKIEALPEGMPVPVSNALLQVENTDEKCAWLPGYIETAMLRAVWYPTTIATLSWYCREVIQRYLTATADDGVSVYSRLHDFGSKGATSQESASIGGLAHLVNFNCSDNVCAIMAGRRFYHERMAGFSIAAAEHSSITIWGVHGELDAYKALLDAFLKPGKTVSVVSDSYDLWNAIDQYWGGELKATIEGSGGTLMVRPDSGDPFTIVPETLDRLMGVFGYVINRKGYKVLPPYVRVMQADGVSLTMIERILGVMKNRNQSAENVVFGMGSELLQKLNRDTQQFAMKASAAKVNGLWRDINKDPVTDSLKRSKPGRLAVVQDPTIGVRTIRRKELGHSVNLFRTVYENGVLLIDESLETIRKRAGWNM